MCVSIYLLRNFMNTLNQSLYFFSLNLNLITEYFNFILNVFPVFSWIYIRMLMLLKRIFTNAMSTLLINMTLEYSSGYFCTNVIK